MYAYLFALNLKKANIEKCQKHASKDPFYAKLFIKNIKGADKKKYIIYSLF